jgi:hypothetical protein
VGYAKNNALKGRQFASLGEQNGHLLHWEGQVADKRTRRQLAAVFEDVRKALGALPASVYESYQEGRRRVQPDSFVEVNRRCSRPMASGVWPLTRQSHALIFPRPFNHSISLDMYLVI